MADGRFVNKKIAYDLPLNSVSIEADFLFTRMIPHLDREGRMPGNPRQVKALAVPMRDELSVEVVEGCLLELVEADLIRWYVVDGRMAISFPGFDKNQKGLRKEREAESLLPSPENGAAVEVTRSLLDGSGVGPESSGVGPRKSKFKSKSKSKSKSNTGAKAPTSNGGRSTNGGPPDPEIGVVEDPEPSPADWMHDIWHEVLGIDGHPIKLTEKRRRKYESMHDEHLREAPDPEAAWRAVLFAVTRSDHHMSKRAYQMPESLLRNEERRETWVQRTISTLKDGGGSKADQKFEKRRREVLEYLEVVDGGAA